MIRDVDLIPSDYRHSRWLRAWSKNVLVIVSASVSFCLLTYFLLRWQADQLQADVDVLQRQTAVTAQQRSDLESLSKTKSTLRQQLAMLTSLRSGAPARSVFSALDSALGDSDIWFLKLQFKRAGVIVPDDQAKSVETGYFIVVPEGRPNRSQKDWLVETHMTITGQARDHETLSKFVNNLYKQRPVVDVSVQKTERRNRASVSIVEFDLAVVLNSEARG